jgi:hypothetical protein
MEMLNKDVRDATQKKFSTDLAGKTSVILFTQEPKRLAHQCALESPRVRGEMIEATEFPHLAQKHHVFGVPKTVMNESVSVDGAVPEEIFLEHILKAAGMEKA